MASQVQATGIWSEVTVDTRSQSSWNFYMNLRKKEEKNKTETFYPAAKEMNSSCCRPSSPPHLSQPQRGERLTERQSADDMLVPQPHAASFTTNLCPSISPGTGVPSFSSSAKLEATRSNGRCKHSPVFVFFQIYSKEKLKMK